MAKRLFTKEEMELLKGSDYVLDVHPGTVFFSADFKELFWEELRKGMKAREIFIKYEIDPDILGDTRIAGFASMVKKAGTEGSGFKDLTSYNEFVAAYVSPEEKIKQLERKLAYKEQELEFLKKIVSLGEEVGE